MLSNPLMGGGLKPRHSGANLIAPLCLKARYMTPDNLVEYKATFTDWLAGLASWDHFITITFKEPRLPHHAIATLNSIERFLHRDHLLLRLFLGTELHILRTLHVHGLVSVVTASNRVSRATMEADLTKRFGWSKVRPIWEIGGAAGYVTKYVTKELTEYNIW